MADPYNDPESIKEWMNNALNKSDITDKERQLLSQNGQQVIDDGGWRGDVCDSWRLLGEVSDRVYDSSKIHDFYP